VRFEKKHITPISEKPIIFPIAGLIFGLFIWVFDAIIDVVFIGDQQSLLDNILSPDNFSELWMRSLILIIFVLIGFYSRYVLIKHIKLDNTLLEYQEKLEEIIENRTRDLIDRTTQLETLANTDPLTGLYNRRKFSQLLDHELDRFQRYQQSFSIVNIDIDHFKKINDTFGHTTGDKVLQQFSNILKNNIRRSDSAGRWGGEEFIILIIESSKEQTKQVADNLIKIFNETDFDLVGKVTASIGITQVSQGDTHEDIVRRSDNALYKAKEKGRNRVETLSR
jgi:diguanylate cyclase (GGDEF)-like protein